MAAILAAVPEAGGYISIVKLAVMIVMIWPWLFVAPWVHKDTRKVRVPSGTWCGLVVGAGALGFALWLVIPIYAIGLALFLIFAWSSVLIYVFHRNGKVSDEYKVLTGQHLSKVFSGGQKKEEGPQVAVRVKVYTHDGRPVPLPQAETPEVVTFNTMQNLLYDMLWKRASEADLAPAGEQTRIRYVIDGVVAEQLPMPLPQSEALVQYIKMQAGMDLDERRRPQQGKVSVDWGKDNTELIIATAGTTGGQRMQIKVAQEFVQTRLDELGIADDLLERLRSYKDKPGVILVSGKSGNGVTSTLYSIMRDYDAFMLELVAIEMKPQIELENIKQNKYTQSSEQPEKLSYVLRRDPDVVLLDEIADAKTVPLLLEAAGEKRFLVGVNASDTFSALAKWVKVCQEPSQAVAPVKAVTCQVLVRKLCPSCKEAYRPDPQLLAKANLPSSQIHNFYRPPTKPRTDEEGNPITCPTCQGSGYFGRTGVFELLEVTDEIRQAVVSGASLSQIRAIARKNKMLYLQEQGLRKVIDGVTSIQELIRVTQAKKTK